MANKGVRGGIVHWHTRDWDNEPLGVEANRYLDELVRVRQYLQAGKGDEDKHYEREARQWHIREMLYEWYYIDTDVWVCKCKEYCG